MPKEQSKKIIRLPEAVREYGFSRSQLYNAGREAYSGTLPRPLKIDGSLYFDRAELVAELLGLVRWLMQLDSKVDDSEISQTFAISAVKFGLPPEAVGFVGTLLTCLHPNLSGEFVDKLEEYLDFLVMAEIAADEAMFAS